MVWPEEIQQKYEEEINVVAYGKISVVHPGYKSRITDQIYKKNDELNTLLNNPKGKKVDHLAKVDKVKSELSALMEQDNKIIEDNKSVDTNYHTALESEVAILKSVSSNKWTAIRNVRRWLLSECDWTQLQDAPIVAAKKTEWASYRQSLRDLPETYTTVDSIVWPVKPE